MTRRITLAILFSVWTMLLAAGVTAYFTTRSVLLHELDARIVARAAALPEVSGLSGTAPEAGDRFLVRSASGRVLRRAPATAPANKPKVLSAQFAQLADGNVYRSVSVEFDKPAGSDNGSITVVYSTPAEGFDRVLQELTLSLGLFGMIGSALAGVIAAAAARKALQPLNRVAEVVGTINEQSLSRRVEADQLPPELQVVGTRLNEMLQRIEHFTLQRRQFLADASHELRTPVAALLTTLQVNLARRQSDTAATQQVLEDCLIDARLLRNLVERLTSQVRGELEMDQNALVETNLSLLLQDCVSVAKGLGLAKQLQINSQIPAHLVGHTQPDRLRRIILNLLSNAIAYNVEGGSVTLTASGEGNVLVIEVQDTGLGISSEHLPHVFSAFYRVDNSRSDAAASDGHLGLGLYQVQSDVALLNGTCDVISTVGKGTTFTIRFDHCLVESAAPTTNVSGVLA